MPLEKRGRGQKGNRLPFAIVPQDIRAPFCKLSKGCGEPHEISVKLVKFCMRYFINLRELAKGAHITFVADANGNLFPLLLYQQKKAHTLLMTARKVFREA
jgi:hypothetical protein